MNSAGSTKCNTCMHHMFTCHTLYDAFVQNDPQAATWASVESTHPTQLSLTKRCVRPHAASQHQTHRLSPNIYAAACMLQHSRRSQGGQLVPAASCCTRCSRLCRTAQQHYHPTVTAVSPQGVTVAVAQLQMLCCDKYWVLLSKARACAMRAVSALQHTLFKRSTCIKLDFVCCRFFMPVPACAILCVARICMRHQPCIMTPHPNDQNP